MPHTKDAERNQYTSWVNPKEVASVITRRAEGEFPHIEITLKSGVQVMCRYDHEEVTRGFCNALIEDCRKVNNE